MRLADRSSAVPWLALLLLAPAIGLSAPAQAPGDPPQEGAPVEDPADGEQAPDGHARMLELLDDIARRTPQENPYFGVRERNQLLAQVRQLPAQTPPATVCLLLLRLGNAELNLGNEEQAIGLLTQAYELLPRAKRLQPAQRNEIVYRLAIAHLRHAETVNCCARFTVDSCLLPIQGGGIHVEQAPSELAVRYFEEVLTSEPPNSRLALAARWLLNIAYMTLGRWPDGVPEPWRIPPSAFASAEEVPRFFNISPELGLDTFSLAGGAIADDFDGDGYVDLVVTTFDTEGQMRFFRNRADGRFEDRTEEAGLLGLRGGLSAVQGDYDGDGNLDVLVLRGAWMNEAGRHPNSLLQNQGGAKFRDVTFEAGLGEQHFPTQTAAWADYDNDGDLDLYIGNESAGNLRAASQLFQNQGDGTFKDVTRLAGVANERFAKAVVWGDFDADGWPDLYVSNLGQENRLYRNLGDGTFLDVAKEAGVTGPLLSFPCWFWDHDQDGNLDLFVAAYAANVSDLAAAVLGFEVPAERARLYRGDGKGRFQDVAREAGIVLPSAPMGSNFGDLDGDGFPDMYLGTGYPDYQDLMPNVLYLNRGGRRFVDVTSAAGMGQLQKGHAVVFADFNHDGLLDVFQQMGGAVGGDRYKDSFYENPGLGARWLAVELVGVRTNRSGIGARIALTVEGEDGPRTVYRHVSSGGSFGGNPLRQHLGLGETERILRLEVRWPTTGETQTFEEVPLDRIVRIVEGRAELELRDLPGFRYTKRP